MKKIVVIAAIAAASVAGAETRDLSAMPSSELIAELRYLQGESQLPEMGLPQQSDFLRGMALLAHCQDMSREEANDAYSAIIATVLNMSGRHGAFRSIPMSEWNNAGRLPCASDETHLVFARHELQKATYQVQVNKAISERLEELDRRLLESTPTSQLLMEVLKDLEAIEGTTDEAGR